MRNSDVVPLISLHLRVSSRFALYAEDWAGWSSQHHYQGRYFRFTRHPCGMEK
jgi:hypothetical protein